MAHSENPGSRNPAKISALAQAVGDPELAASDGEEKNDLVRFQTGLVIPIGTSVKEDRDLRDSRPGVLRLARPSATGDRR